MNPGGEALLVLVVPRRHCLEFLDSRKEVLDQEPSPYISERKILKKGGGHLRKLVRLAGKDTHTRTSPALSRMQSLYIPPPAPRTS